MSVVWTICQHKKPLLTSNVPPCAVLQEGELTVEEMESAIDELVNEAPHPLYGVVSQRRKYMFTQVVSGYMNMYGPVFVLF